MEAGAVSVEEAQGVRYKIRDLLPLEMTFAVAGIEMDVHSARIPAEKIVLLLPGKWTLRGEGLV